MSRSAGLSRTRHRLVPVGLLCFHVGPSVASRNRGRNSMGIPKRVSSHIPQSQLYWDKWDSEVSKGLRMGQETGTILGQTVVTETPNLFSSAPTA